MFKVFQRIRKSVEDSWLGAGGRTWSVTWKQHKTIIKLLCGLAFILVFGLVGFLGNANAVSSGLRRSISFAFVAGYGCRYILIVLLLWFVIVLLILKWLSKFNRHSSYDPIRGFTEVNEKSLASATRLKDGPEKDASYKSSQYFEMTDIIFGRDIDHPERLLTQNKDCYGMNQNIIIVGPPGCGKTRCWVIPTLFQLIRRGESCICTDSKADIYGYVWWVAHMHGYETKFINFDSKTICHSDGVDLFAAATKSDEECYSLAETVVANISTTDKKDDFWYQAGRNLLVAVMLLVKNDPTRTEKSLAEVRRTLSQQPAQLIAEFNLHRREGSMLTTCADGFIAAPPVVQQSVYSGLSMQLNLLALPAINKVLSEDEVDISLIGKKPCMYFVNLSDMKRDLDFITALFFECVISELSNLADDGELKVPVTLLFEEFANIGKIPQWHEKMSVLRSRRVTPIMVVQDIEQLAIKYGEKEANIIFDDCATQVFLGSNNLATLKMFSELIGDTEVEIQESRTKEVTSKFNPIKGTVTETPTLRKATRPLYRPDELRRMRYPREIVVMSQTNVCEMERLDKDYHPMTAEVRPIKALAHMPEWVKKLDPLEYEEYGIVIDKFKTEEQMLKEKGWDMDIDKAYHCTKKDFMKLYRPSDAERTPIKSSGTAAEQAEEQQIMSQAKKIEAIRDKYGETLTLQEMEEKGLMDIFSFDDNE